ncbi:MAG: DsrE family protein [Proteobacteria bacterium]|nr:DsrE family protein [Pseudomonadota bacterium]
MNTLRIVRATRLPWVAAFVLGLASAPLALAQGAAPAKPLPPNKLVIQVSDADPAKWNLALNNATNVQADLGAQNVAIEIVAYGPGIGMLKMDSPVAGRVDQSIDAGVRFVACENTMHGQKLTKTDMLNNISYAKAGVVELMQKQQQGWTYIRP